MENCDFLYNVQFYSDEQFCKHFHLTRQTAEIIINYFVASDYCRLFAYIPAQTQIYFLLSFLANEKTFTEVASLFEIPVCTAFDILDNAIDFMVQMSQNIIKFPDTEQTKAIVANSFEEIADMKYIIGCIGSLLLFDNNPAEAKSPRNRGDLPIVIQTVCAANRRLLHIYVAGRGYITNSKLFKESAIDKLLPYVCGYTYKILSTISYPANSSLLSNIVSYETAMEEWYFRAHYLTRRRLYDTFRILRNRFKQLGAMQYYSEQRIRKIVIACCTIHNICIDYNDSSVYSQFHY